MLLPHQANLDGLHLVKLSRENGDTVLNVDGHVDDAALEAILWTILQWTDVHECNTRCHKAQFQRRHSHQHFRDDGKRVGGKAECGHDLFQDFLVACAAEMDFAR